MEIKEDYIIHFEHGFVPGHHNPKVDGYYMTIRCGLEGIYYNLNEWKDGHWMVRILDDSRVIAYSRELISKEAVNEWARKKLEKYHK